MKSVATPFPNPGEVLAGAQFADSYVLQIRGPSLDAEAATRHVMGRTPGWIAGLMSLRNALVKPLGLKAAPDKRLSDENSIGRFPLISRSPRRVVLGLDDRHLDFRILVDVADLGDRTQSVTASTVVRTHNLPGRVYLAIVKPFHRVIVPAMLTRAATA